MTHRVRTDCRLCTATPLETVLELHPTPPANEFLARGQGAQEKFPLYLARCKACGHVQLPVVVDPKRLFSSYVYVSGTSPAFVDHFCRYAEAMISEHNLKPGDLVVEVGSNDGTLLKFFRDAGMRVVGVDPAEAIAAEATKAGVPTRCAFFDRKVARQIHEAHGPAALVVANNVFAHADDLHEIALGVRDLLDLSRGRFVFEVQYLVDLVEKGLFDMVYHEHLSYHHLAPLLPFFEALAMRVVDAAHVPTHGGSLRCTVAPRKSAVPSDRVDGFLRVERSALAGDPWGKLRNLIDLAANRLDDFLDRAKSKCWLVAGYGAPAKLTTLTHEFSLTAADVAYVIDDSPWKQGLRTPGTLIPIVSSEHLTVDRPDAIIVFAWNFAEPIVRKLREGGYGGTIVVPLPEYKEMTP